MSYLIRLCWQQITALDMARTCLLQVARELESVASRITTLRQDVERASSAVTMGERSLQIARQQAAEARKLLNPLNHPQVQALVGRK